jgi:small subunit ribosomal protein S20
MANTKSAAKRARQTIRRTAVNRRVKNRVKVAVKRAKEALTAGDKTKASEIVLKTQAVLDKAAKTGQIHKNKAARHKSQFSLKLATLK